MNHLKIAILLSVVMGLFGCGRQVVQFDQNKDVLDAGKVDDAGPKLPQEAGPDASIHADATTPDATTPDATAPDATASDATVPDAGAAVAPVVRSTVPLPAATAVPLDEAVLATFSKAMDPATITSQTFLVQQGSTAVSGTVSLNGATNTATFTPTAMLSANQLYTATITTEAKDTGGLALLVSYTWTFTTGAAPTAPRVASTTPADASDAAVNTRPTATFASAMNAATITNATFLVRQGVTPIDGGVTYDAASNTATFAPSTALDPSLVYTATVTTGAKGTTGLPLVADYSWSFTTRARPMVLSALPASSATAVPTNDSVFATFSKPMDAATFSTSTFTLMQDTAAVAGAVTWNTLTDTATFNPTAPLAPSTMYTATITTGVKDADGVGLTAIYTWSFTTAVGPAAPRVVFTTPAANASARPISTRPTATFSSAMDPATINGMTFTVQQGATSVPGVVTYDVLTNTATFSPTNPLGNALPYTGTITNGATDTTGLALAADYAWTFTTVNAAPTVTANVPLANAIDVLPNDSLSATFNRAMNPATITALTFTLTRAGIPAPVLGVVSYDALANSATFAPAGALAAGTLYTATITTGAQDAMGLALAANYVWTFTTQATPLIVSPTTPLANAVGVPITMRPTATFSQPMDALTITGSTFTLTQGLNPVAGTVGYDIVTNTATFTPTAPLGLNLPYAAAITTGARAVSGSTLASDYVWNFTTSACSQSPVVLGAAANFAVLGGSTVTSTSTVLSPTVINGDLGVSPGTAVTGFPPGMVIGMIEAGTTTSATAIADLTTAYNSAAGRVLCPVTIAGNLGGMTLAPGLYKSTSSLAISSGDLTLDAQGNGDAIFIFQMASTLTTTDDGRKVILTNGAKSANIFWQVGTSATIGVSSVFHGTIMADQAITLKTGASLTGRALARIAAVSLDTNSVVKPAP